MASRISAARNMKPIAVRYAQKVVVVVVVVGFEFVGMERKNWE